MRDEGFQTMQGRSAVTALNVLIILLFFGGMLYDVLATHTWPYRSFSELILIIVVWSTVRYPASHTGRCRIRQDIAC